MTQQSPAAAEHTEPGTRHLERFVNRAVVHAYKQQLLERAPQQPVAELIDALCAEHRHLLQSELDPAQWHTLAAKALRQFVYAQMSQKDTDHWLSQLPHILIKLHRYSETITDVFTLHFFAGMPLERIAEVLDLNPDEVHKMWIKAQLMVSVSLNQ